MAIEVRMAKKAGGRPGIDELRPRCPEELALLVRQVFRSHLANTARTHEQEVREGQGFIGCNH
jgi:hypothetical protein